MNIYKITSILDVEKGTSKAGKDWQKQNFVIDTGEKFNNIICFQVFGADKCEALTKYNKVGDVVNVSFNVSSREYNGKYYHNLDAWMIKLTDENVNWKLSEPQTFDENGVADLPF